MSADVSASRGEVTERSLVANDVDRSFSGSSLASPFVDRLALEDPLALPDLSRSLRFDHLVWDGFVAGKRRVDLHPVVLDERAHEDAKGAALATYAAVREIGRLALDSPEEAAHYRFSPRLLALAGASHLAGDHARLVRVDLLVAEDGRFRACEVNADCPGGLNEAVGLPALLTRAGYKHVNRQSFDVVRELAEALVEASGGPGSPRGTIALVFATAYAEDLQVCALVERAIVAAGGRAVRTAPTALSVRGDTCFVGEDAVSVLYRFFPSEHFAEWPETLELARLVTLRRLSAISSFSCMFEQSKLAFERGYSLIDHWSPSTKHAIAARFPETRSPLDVPLVEQRVDWVLKKALGRVGDEVFVGALESDDEWQKLVDGVSRAVRGGEPWIAQRFVKQRTVPTPWGPRYLTLGAYVLDGRFAGYFARLTEIPHTSHDALVLPVVVRAARAASAHSTEEAP
jgi:glutathionylspermidine synthase